MLAKIIRAEVIDDTHIGVRFSDGKTVSYDVSGDYALPEHYKLKQREYFSSFSVDASGTSIVWDSDVAFPSDMLYEYGEEMEVKSNG